MHYKNFHLDEFQEKAIQAIERNHSVVVSAPTGSGKTLIADFIVNKDIEKGIRVIYTAPIKALSNQKYKEFCAEYGEDKIGLMTGDTVKNPGAPILIMTTEIYRNMAISKDHIMANISYVIFDEIHYINDVERGYVWEESIIFSQDTVRFLCLSATIPNAQEFADWISAIKKHEVEVIVHDHRHVPLEKKFYDTELGITTLDKIKEIIDIPDHNYIQGISKQRRTFVKPPNHIDLVKEIKDKTPCMFFTFSRAKTQEFALDLSKYNLFPTDAQLSSFARKKLEESPKEVRELETTRMLLQVLSQGIAFHHAGLLPVLKDIVEDLFEQGKIKVLYTTETFAVGINMPAKTVCFESLRKFDGINFRILNSKEYFQIAGRAGRRGKDTHGYVYSMIQRRDFDYQKIKEVTTKDIEPIQSQFKLSTNTALNLIKNHNQVEIETILKYNFHTFQKYGEKFRQVKKNQFMYQFEKTKERLTKLGYIKGNFLTEKGDFAAQIYSDEILTGEIFATEIYQELNEYQLLLVIACIAYEAREKTEFFKEYQSKFLTDLKNVLHKSQYLSRENRFNYLENLSALIHPCYTNKDIFEIMHNTNLIEGDLIRFFRQMLDRINQVKQATKDERLRMMLRSCQDLILNCLRAVDTV